VLQAFSRSHSYDCDALQISRILLRFRGKSLFQLKFHHFYKIHLDFKISVKAHTQESFKKH